jgi:hypothetical protein
MKLRISGNSLRLRLSRSDVARLERFSCVEDAVEFGPDCKLSYSLAVSAESGAVHASLNGGSINVLIPRDTARSWIGTDSLTISAQQDIGEGKNLQILIEKDLKCAHKGLVENEDSYPNPLVSNLA